MTSGSKLSRVVGQVLKKRGAFSIALFAAFSCFAVDGHSKGSMSKKQKLRIVQKMNRGAEVTLARSLSSKEAQYFLRGSADQYINWLLSRKEFEVVYRQRLYRFVKLSQAEKSSLPVRIPSSFRPGASTRPLEQVLGNLIKDRHDGSSCGEDGNVRCFIQWLGVRMSVPLPNKWVESLPHSTISYQEFMDRLIHLYK